MVLSKNSVVLVNSLGYVTSLIFCLLRWLSPSHEVIYTIHGLPLKENGYRNKERIPNSVYLQDMALQKILLLSRKAVCVSKLQEEYLRKNYQCNAKIVAIHNGTNIKTFNSAFVNRDRRAIMAGGIDNLKSTIETMQAFFIYNSRNPKKWKLDIYGNISDKSLMPVVSELCQNSNGLISYHGQLAQESLHQEISKSDIYIAMSKWDTFNLAALEAMSLGAPCICSKQSGVSELIIHNNNGFLVDTESASLIEDCINILLTICDLGDNYMKLRKAAYDTASINNWSYVVEKYISFSEKT